MAKSTASDNLEVGSSVRLKNLKKSGVIIQRLKSGGFLVQVGNMKYRCKEDELEAATLSSKKKKKSRKGSSQSTRSSSPHSVDLHGLTVAEGEIALDNALNAALLKNCDALIIIHGHGTGTMQRFVARYLASQAYVARFQIDQQNTGQTIAYLR